MRPRTFALFLAALASPLLLPACGGGSATHDDADTPQPDDSADPDARPDDGAEPEADAGDDGRAEASDDGEPPDADGADAETVPIPPACGDGMVDPGEECDDGNRMNNDGCDWLCRSGDGSYDYPDPDPSVPTLEPGGDPVTIGPEAGWVGGEAPLRVVWSHGVYGVAYAIEYPYFAMKLVVLDAMGALVGGPWTRATPFAVPRFALAATDDGFAVLTRLEEDDTTTLSLLDSTATPLGEDLELVDPPTRLSRARLGGAVFDGSFVVAYDDPGTWAVHRFDAEGSFLRSSGAFDLPRSGMAMSSVSIFALPAGYAVGDVLAAAILDRDLGVVRWTGMVPRGDLVDWGSYTRALACSDESLFLLWAYARAWMTAVGFDGELLYPPRTVPSAISSGFGPYSGIKAAWGPAGLGIAFSNSADGFPPTSEINVVNVDRWANLISGPLAAFGPDDGVRQVASFELVADDVGFAVVAWTIHTSEVEYSLELRRFVPAP